MAIFLQITFSRCQQTRHYLCVAVARPATTKLPTIPTSTPTTVMTTLLVEAVTHTTPHGHHTPGPHHIETPNSVDSDDNEGAGDDHKKGEPLSSQSENKEDDGGDNNSSSGLGSVAMYTIIISFLVIASLWGLVWPIDSFMMIPLHIVSPSPILTSWRFSRNFILSYFLIAVHRACPEPSFHFAFRFVKCLLPFIVNSKMCS